MGSRIKERVKCHSKDAVSKISTMGKSLEQVIIFLTTKCMEDKERAKEDISVVKRTIKRQF